MMIIIIIPVIIRSVGTTSISFRNYLKNIPVVHIKEIHTTAILLTLESTDVKVQKICVGCNCNSTCVIYCNHRIAATLYTVGTR